MYLIKNKRKKLKQKGGFFMLPALFATNLVKKIKGKGIKKRKCYKRKKQKGGFLLSMDEIWG